MGKAVARIIETRPELGLCVAVKRENGQAVLGDFDVVIDFSSPQGAQEAFAMARKHRRPFLTGTTNLSETFLFQMQEEEKFPFLCAQRQPERIFFHRTRASGGQNVPGVRF